MHDVTVPPSTVHLWWACPDDASEQHLVLLTDVERCRRSAFYRDVDRNRFTVGVALSRLVLASVVGTDPAALEIVRECLRCGAPDHGKPRLRTPGAPEFSVAHAGRFVVLAVAPGPVGVDVEARARMPGAREIGAAVLAPDERARLNGRTDAGQRDELLATWVRKEAVLKSIGAGLAIEMSSLTVTAADEPAAVLATRPPLPTAARYTLADLAPDAEHRAAVATVDQPGAAVVEHDATALLM